MMNRLIVSVDLEQKRDAVVNGISFALGKKYNHNFRESSPVVAIVQESENGFLKDDVLICHHNHFYGDSPFRIEEELYSIPINRSIFAKISDNGELLPICDNIICTRVDKEYLLSIPPSSRKTYDDRLIIQTAAYGYRKGQLVFTEPKADYEIIYVWDGEEKRVIKVWKEDIVAVLN
jgi:hypothetical protein